MTALRARVAGIGFWADGLPGWDAARAFAAGAPAPADAPRRPAPELLAPNERRRAPETVAVALEVALAACRAAGRDPAELASVFASAHGDFGITDYMCATLAADPRAVSPTRFHNSVHNAAAGYWTIGTGCTGAATALCAGPHTFAQGLIEALAQLATGADAVLLVGYDGAAVGPLTRLAPSRGLLGGALVLARADDGPGPALTAALADGAGGLTTGEGPLARRIPDNAMSPMLPLFDALAGDAREVALAAGGGQLLRLEIEHG